MPIRRAAATPTQEKAPSAAAEKEPEVATKDSSFTDEEPAASSAAAESAEMEEAEAPDGTEPTENGEKEDGGEEEEPKESENKEDKELKDGYKYEKSKAKKVKRTIPAWASVAASKKVPVSNFAGTQHKVDNILVEAITSCNTRYGVSYQSVMKFIVKKYPGMDLDRKKFLLKRSLKKHLDNGTIKRLKGKGLSGTFVIGKQPVVSKKPPQMTESLGDALPLIITRLCEPKEASYSLIKKYLEQHFPNLHIETRPQVLKTALVKAVEKGHLEQITGKGASGTFQLKRTGNQVLLKGGAVEDAITAAITAMNEPKTCSTTSLRKFLVDSNKEKKEHVLVACLRRTLKKCKVLGWMEQITGHGFTGTYQLSFPFYPSPTILYPDKFNSDPKKTRAAKRKQTVDTSDEESEEESEEEESEDEAPPRRKSQKRPPPKARHPPPAKKSRSASRGRGRALAKKSPAKKAVSSSKRPAGRTSAASKKESLPPSKSTPVKRGAPAKKPKKPAVKKLAKRGSKRPAPKESSDEEDEEEEEEEEDDEEEEVVKETARGGSKRSKSSESSPKPAAKKQASRSRSSRPEASPAKKGAKSTRKSKRGRR